MAGWRNSDRLRAMLGARIASIALPLCLLLALTTSTTVATAQSIPTFLPGPHFVGSADWDFGPLDVSKPGGGGEPLSVEHFGTLRYPARMPGAGAPIAPGGPFPFVVFAHGRFQEAPFIGHNHEQASYLLDHLASWGFVVASVNLDVVGQFGQPAAIKQRGELIQATLQAFHAQDPSPYKIDFDRVGLVGHSRGGEGCLAAWKANTSGLPIRGIATIGLTNFQDLELKGTPYLGLYGSKDGDVNNGWPIQVYDQAEASPKLFEYIEGANHFWFTDSIAFGGEGQALITREQHHDVARTYITAFLIHALRGTPARLAELSDGPSLAPITDTIAVHPLYADPQRLLINHFEDAGSDAALNSLGGASVGNLLATQAEESLDNNAKSFFQRTHGGWLAYEQGLGPRLGRNAPPELLPAYVEHLPGGVDARPYTHLSLNVLQRWNAPLNEAGASQDLDLLLVDTHGASAQVPLSDWGTIPWPITHNGGAFPKKSVLRTTRVPLGAFRAANPQLDFSAIELVSLVFDHTASAELRIDDLSFTR